MAMTERRTSVLVVDDEQISRETTGQQLRDAGYEAYTAASAEIALAMMTSHPIDIVLTDLRMPGMTGLELLAQLRDRAPGSDVLLMTAYGSVESAVSAMRAGAVDYLTKPFRFPELEVRLARIVEHRRTRIELARLRAAVGSADNAGIIGRSPAMERARERVNLFAGHDAPVLITGETGTGKEVVARAIHRLGARAERPFVALACGAIPAELAESQLFGHEKGAFTGATQRRLGCFERADGGTLLLDDVDDLPALVQVKLLRVLQEGTLSRVGGEESIAVDVRVIATTKIDLAEAAESGRFRDDLYYRLRGLEIHLPPLRERGDDVLLLASHFLNAHSSPPAKLSSEATAALRQHAWPGNVRELERVIESALVLAGDNVIEPRHLPDALASERAARPFQLNLDGVEQVHLPTLMHDIESEILAWAMARADGQQTRAAELLGVPRTSLQSKLTRK
jgi:DNA-binding NtrC family response regulator